jgi:hypothetical protein
LRFGVMSDWFEVYGADTEFSCRLWELARGWPPLPTTGPDDTGGWTRPGLLITYADRIDRAQHAVQASFRVDFDGVRAMAARVSGEHVDQSSVFRGTRAEGADPVEIACGTARECAEAAVEWFRRQLDSC